MQQAVRVLYGQASPSEAFAGATIDPQPLELAAFLGHVAANAAQAGVPMCGCTMTASRFGCAPMSTRWRMC
jgi:hypothetical protein